MVCDIFITTRGAKNAPSTLCFSNTGVGADVVMLAINPLCKLLSVTCVHSEQHFSIQDSLHSANILPDICERAAAKASADRTLYEMKSTCLGYNSYKACELIMPIRAGTKAYQSSWQGMQRPLSSNFSACMHKDVSIIGTFVRLPDLL